MERKPKHARTRSAGGAAGVFASFLRSTAASFSSSSTNFAAPRTGTGGGKSSFNHRNAFSGPMVSIVPPEARGGGRRGSNKKNSGYRTPEPSSPKVSCIGQIKRSKSKSKKTAKKAAAACCGKDGGACPLPPRPPTGASGARPKSSLVKRMSFFRRSRSRSSSSKPSGRGSTAVHAAAPAPAPAPGAGLGHMKRFTSGRAAFQDFDWKEAERRGSDDEDEEYSFVDDGFVAHSAPLVLGGGVVASEPRKEVNLWRRRPMSPPTPLQLP